MRIQRSRVPEGFLDQDLARRIGDVLLPADDVGYLHFCIINDDREMIEWVVYAACYRKIAELGRIKGDIAAHDVGKGDAYIWIAQSHDGDLGTRLALALFFGNICLVFLEERIDSSLVPLAALGLAEKFVPREAEPLYTFDDIVLVLARTALSIGVFAPENDGAAVFSRKKIIDERHSCRTDVAVARRARWKANFN